MSELKVHKIGDLCFDFKMGKDVGIDFYLKSEADKVIAEKDKEIQRLENLCESYRIDCDNLAIREANACKEIERDNKQIRHQKYKRCLAMAYVEWLKQMSLCNYPDSILYRMAARRERKWKKIAEKFKPNKEAK